MHKIFEFFRFVGIFILFALLVWLTYMGVIWLRGGEDFFLLTRKSYTFDTFLSNLRGGAVSPTDEHRRIYKVLKSLKQERLGNTSQSSNIPYDYTFFFQEVAPTFLDNSSQLLQNIPDDLHILATFNSDADYVTKLLLLNGAESKILRGKRIMEDYSKRLEMTGTYTSEFHYPTGLFVIEGHVINPVLQKWDGLLILDAAGKLYIKDINSLEYRLRRFNITHSYQDYLDFLKLAKKEKLSIFQTHLLINRGEIDASPDLQRRFRRRAIFQDRQHRVSIYDSFEKQPTLYELAETLQQDYGATEAVNLDMGPFGYCARYENGVQTELYMGKAKSIQLSNIIIFNYN